MCTKVLAVLAVYLGLMHVHVRKCTATKLYEAIVIHGDKSCIPEENVDEVRSAFRLLDSCQITFSFLLFKIVYKPLHLLANCNIARFE